MWHNYGKFRVQEIFFFAVWKTVDIFSQTRRHRKEAGFKTTVKFPCDSLSFVNRTSHLDDVNAIT